MTRDHFGGREALLRRLVGQERRPDDVADREDMRVRGPQLPVHFHVTAGPELDSRLIRVQRVRIRPPADRYEDDVRSASDESLGSLDIDDGLILVDPPSPRLRFRMDLDAQLLESPPDDADRLRVRPREQLFQDLDHDHAGAELGVGRPDFEAGDPAPDDGEVQWDSRELEGFLRAQHTLPIEPEHREVRGPAARRDDRILEDDLLRARGGLDGGAVRAGERSIAHEDIDAVPLAELADSVRESLDDGFFPDRKSTRLNSSH